MIEISNVIIRLCATLWYGISGMAHEAEKHSGGAAGGDKVECSEYIIVNYMRGKRDAEQVEKFRFKITFHITSMSLLLTLQSGSCRHTSAEPSSPRISIYMTFPISVSIQNRALGLYTNYYLYRQR